MDLQIIEKGSKDRAQVGYCCFNPYTYSSWMEPTDAYSGRRTEKAQRSAASPESTPSKPA